MPPSSPQRCAPTFRAAPDHLRRAMPVRQTPDDNLRTGKASVVGGDEAKPPVRFLKRKKALTNVTITPRFSGSSKAA
jgi:hypothetical protein